MKAQRRHDLKDNTLAKKLVVVPSFTKTYGPRILLAVIGLGLIALLIRSRMQSSEQQQLEAQTKMLEATQELDQLRYYGSQDYSTVPFKGLLQNASHLQQLYDDGVKSAKDALSSASEKQTQFRAQTQLCLGDLNWTMANKPPLPGASTQPSLQPTLSRVDMLKEAESAYKTIIGSYPNEQPQATAARFGLAAIAEDLAAGPHGDPNQFDKARQQYQAILDSDAAPEFQSLAKSRMDSIDALKQPPLIGVGSLSNKLAPLGPVLMPTTMGSGLLDVNPQVTTRPTTLPTRYNPLPDTETFTMPGPGPGTMPSTAPNPR